MARRKKKIKLALTLVLGVPLGAVFWYFFLFRQGPQPALPLPQAATKAIMALSKVRQTATKDGIVQWKLEADTAEMEADTGRMVLQSPEVDFFLEDGSQVHLTAQWGTLYTRNNNIEVQGNVHLHSDRYTLVTEELAYSSEHQLITTKKEVRINGKTIQLHAAAMTYDLKTNEARFTGPVKGILHENPVM
jgi:lipopolysaccharide export system protein LptC